MEVITKICAECGEENNVVWKEPKQNNPKAILFICQSCRVRNLRDGTVLPLEKRKAFPKAQIQEKPKVIQDKEVDESKDNNIVRDIAWAILATLGIALGIKTFTQYKQGRGPQP
ncbi:MAG: hypothetical protein PHE30_02450 [Candidatus Omnitrophica bacterium]|nr:hypothetical protein [Candidatus Omnitrophota bacterium]